MSEGGRPPRRNRVLPTGDIISHPARGLFMGNRGCLHDDKGTLGTALWRGMRWIICRTEFKGRQRAIMAPGRYTELFFLDEAVALAAGHRPCAECRRDAYRAFVASAEDAGLPSRSARDIDARLHDARIDRETGARRSWRAELDDLPDGSFIRMAEGIFLVLGRCLVPFEDYRYGRPHRRPAGLSVDVLTPEFTVRVLGHGYRPAIHPAASSSDGRLLTGAYT